MSEPNPPLKLVDWVPGQFGRSTLRVALVAEGATDRVIIEAALRALLPPFVLSVLQPEATRPTLGTGWGGVLRWCLEFAQRGYSSLEADPRLPGFDLFVVHLDADVAQAAYQALGQDISNQAVQRGWPPLPNSGRCPPVAHDVDVVRQCLLSWAGLAAPGPKTVLCIPSKASEAWLAPAVLVPSHPAMIGLECNVNVAGQLGQLPKGQRIKKTVRDYRAHEKRVTQQWSVVRQRCAQADQFSTDVGAVLL